MFTGIFKDEDGRLNLLGQGENLTVKEVFKEIDNAISWDCIDDEVYEAFCEELTLNYKDYDDPDELFEDIKRVILEDGQNVL